uniref:Uncharacterized protein n=1 Tax=Candidozyma auris TaxID=498019 RepID=A0A0L0P458_CANAR
MILKPLGGGTLRDPGKGEVEGPWGLLGPLLFWACVVFVPTQLMEKFAFHNDYSFASMPDCTGCSLLEIVLSSLASLAWPTYVWCE